VVITGYIVLTLSLIFVVNPNACVQQETDSKYQKENNYQELPYPRERASWVGKAARSQYHHYGENNSERKIHLKLLQQLKIYRRSPGCYVIVTLVFA